MFFWCEFLKIIIIIVISVSPKSQLNLKEEREKREEGAWVHRLDGSLDRTGSALAPGSLWEVAVRGDPPEEAALAPNKQRWGGKEPEDVF